MRFTPEYRAWSQMKDRCLNPKSHAYRNYGGRGIRVCDGWQASFEVFFEHVGSRPSTKHSLDRKDNNGHYEPGNVRWATRIEQAQNSRNFHHGMRKSPEYAAWQTVRRKGADKPEWEDFTAFYRAVGPRPSPKHVLSVHSGVRWALPSEAAVKKLTDEDVVEVHRLLAQGFKLKEIADRYGVSFQLISYIKLGKARVIRRAP